LRSFVPRSFRSHFERGSRAACARGAPHERTHRRLRRRSAGPRRPRGGPRPVRLDRPGAGRDVPQDGRGPTRGGCPSSTSPPCSGGEGSVRGSS
jgi:hypothetical protein